MIGYWHFLANMIACKHFEKLYQNCIVSEGSYKPRSINSPITFVTLKPALTTISLTMGMICAGNCHSSSCSPFNRGVQRNIWGEGGGRIEEISTFCYILNVKFHGGVGTKDNRPPLVRGGVKKRSGTFGWKVGWKF